MAALLTRHHLLNKKQGLDKQEEEIRRKKESFELEVEIAAAQARLEVLRVSRSSVKGSRCRTSDGMESYMARGAHTALNAEADSFAPGGQGLYDRQIMSRACLTEPDEKKVTLDVAPQIVQQRAPELGMAHSLRSDVSTSHHAASTHAQVPVSDNVNTMLSIMERQNEISALLAQQHNTSHLPRKEIQVFDGDPLQYHAFMRAFEHNVEEKAGDLRLSAFPGTVHQGATTRARSKLSTNAGRQRISNGKGSARRTFWK